MLNLTHLKRPWCWEGLKAGGEGDDGGWDSWMASTTQWTWVWVNSGSWWWTGRPGVLRFMGSQRVRHDWAAELNWITHYHFKRYALEKCPNSNCSLKVTLGNIILMSSEKKKVLKHRCVDECHSGVSSCGDSQCRPRECWTANAGFGQRSFDA